MTYLNSLLLPYIRNVVSKYHLDIIKALKGQCSTLKLLIS